MVVIRSLALLLGGVASVQAIGTALGYGSATTGGGSAAAATPTSTAQLLSWLSDSTARTIVLTSQFDFTNYYGTTSGKICKPWTCSTNAQVAIDSNNWCENYQPSAATGTATWYTSGTGYANSLKVGSNKTLLGKGSSAGIKGIGLLIQNAHNVIIQNINISDINQKFVWGGDAITIVGSTNVCEGKTRVEEDLSQRLIGHFLHQIDHSYIKNVGRQFIVTGYDPAQNITISNNVFDGSGTYSAVCNGMHYWVALFTGTSDTITFAQNYIHQTSGRGPHVGGTSGYTQRVHIVNNYYDNVGGHALDSLVGATVLAEGNYFNAVTTPSIAGDGGKEYFIQGSANLSACKTALGRTCQENTLVGSGSVSRADSAVLSTLKPQSAITKYSPMAASAVSAYVLANAGVGKIN